MRLVAMDEFFRGAIRLHVLHHAAEGPIHGTWMMRELARHGHRVSPGTMYPTLHKMEEDGLVVSRKQVLDGRLLRAYRISPKGRRTLARAQRALRELADEVL
jgi:DNA-binding PadR family transcriptional regulator